MDFRKDLALVLVGAIAGAALSLVLQFWQQNSPRSITILAAILLVVLLMLLILSMLGPLKLILSGSGRTRLAGHWQGKFWYEKNGKTVTISEELTIKQRGRYVTGSSTTVKINGPFPFRSAQYRFRGAIESGSSLIGSWENHNDGRSYFGTLQATVSRKGNIISGAWLGVESNGVRAGEFEWRRA